MTEATVRIITLISGFGGFLIAISNIFVYCLNKKDQIKINKTNKNKILALEKTGKELNKQNSILIKQSNEIGAGNKLKGVRIKGLIEEVKQMKITNSIILSHLEEYKKHTAAFDRSNILSLENSRINQFENRFFQLIKYHRENVSIMEHVSPRKETKTKVKGVKVFLEMKDQFEKINNIIIKLVQQNTVALHEEDIIMIIPL